MLSDWPSLTFDRAKISECHVDPNIKICLGGNNNNLAY